MAGSSFHDTCRSLGRQSKSWSAVGNADSGVLKRVASAINFGRLEPTTGDADEKATGGHLLRSAVYLRRRAKMPLGRRFRAYDLRDGNALSLCV
jgi:hypothetical protein